MFAKEEIIIVGASVVLKQKKYISEQKLRYCRAKYGNEKNKQR
jgi:hypothetical protein